MSKIMQSMYVMGWNCLIYKYEVMFFASKIEFSPHHSINITDTSHTMFFIGAWEYYINLLLFN